MEQLHLQNAIIPTLSIIYTRISTVYCNIKCSTYCSTDFRHIHYQRYITHSGIPWASDTQTFFSSAKCAETPYVSTDILTQTTAVWCF